MINAAAAISTSGRWDAVNARIEQLAKAPPQGKAWHVQLLGNLTSHVFTEYLALKRAYEMRPDDDSSLLAWRARNLLELSVWSMYCVKSEDHARRFYEDAGRDVLGVFKAFTFQKSKPAKRPIGSFQIQKGRRSFSSARQPRESSHWKDYKAVSEAARENGWGQHFAVSYKLLSKFTAHHKTAKIASLI